jgi:hypothetical protein
MARSLSENLLARIEFQHRTLRKNTEYRANRAIFPAKEQ